MEKQMITYQIEKWNSVQPEIEPYAVAHFLETESHLEEIPMDMDWEKLKGLDDLGMLHTVTVRDNGKLVGYFVSLISTHFHYKSTLHAMVYLYYLRPENRGNYVGIKMFQFAEEKLKEIGIQKILSGTKVHLNFSSLFERLGYKNTELIFEKILK